MNKDVPIAMRGRFHRSEMRKYSSEKLLKRLLIIFIDKYNIRTPSTINIVVKLSFLILIYFELLRINKQIINKTSIAMYIIIIACTKLFDITLDDEIRKLLLVSK